MNFTFSLFVTIFINTFKTATTNLNQTYHRCQKTGDYRCDLGMDVDMVELTYRAREQSIEATYTT